MSLYWENTQNQQLNFIDSKWVANKDNIQTLVASFVEFSIFPSLLKQHRLYLYAARLVPKINLDDGCEMPWEPEGVWEM